MAVRSRLETDQPIPETAVQQSILQQAQAAATAQTNPSIRSQEDLLEDADLLDHDAAEDELPPPAYGDVYGDIRNEKDGMGTHAYVTDDGRVNIRVNQLSHRLSQIFTPALRQQVQSAQDSLPPPPPYVPPSLGGDEHTLPPPSMNVVIQVVGSRGDVQPFVALGKVLRDTYGHRVRLATHPNFKDFVEENGLEFFSIGGDPSRLMAFMVKNPGLMPSFRSLMSGDVGQRRKDVGEYIQGCWRSCYRAGNGLDVGNLAESNASVDIRPFVADCIIANPPSFAHIHCAEKMGIPLEIMFTMPYSPTQAFPHPLANIQSNADPQLTNYISYAMIELLSWQGLGDIINRFRKKCLGLEPVSSLWGPGMLQRLKIPHTYCWSPALMPKPKDWGSHISVAGFYRLASDYTPALDLQAFLDAGPPPVYIGFGSIVLEDPNAMTELIFQAVKQTGQRVLLSKGWGGMGAEELMGRTSNGVFMLGNVPHDWLFEHVSCVVHHGGAGTTAAGISAGKPTLVVPFFGDQPFWGAVVAKAGAGPDPIPHKRLTADNLADAIKFCLRPESLERAQALASKVAAERGSDTGAQSFHQHLEVDRLRCTLAPDRPAVWRIRRSKIGLSTFAACTLSNAGLLDFGDLKLFRAQEYYTDEGPWDPISGSFAAFAGTVGSMVGGLGEVPSETVKALRMPYASSSRTQSQTAVSTAAKRSDTSLYSPSSPRQSQTNLHEQGPLTRVRSSRPTLPHRSSSRTSGSGSSPTAKGQMDTLPDSASSRSRLRSWDDRSSGQDRDMLRHTTAHGSKGVGRIVKAIGQGPMDISVSIVQGSHNIPKLWGDNTVRPQERVSDFKSGMAAVGREFAYGWYDGVTGLFTQPWKGAQKEGASGFVKGIGKGVGGFIAKPTAAMFGVPAYAMKGVHKEVQKLIGSNVQSYIVASRTTQGFEEWLESSEAEKQDVVVRWELVQKYTKKKKGDSDDMVRDMLEAQRKRNIEAGRAAGPVSLAEVTDAPTQDSGNMLYANGSQSDMRHANTNHDELTGPIDADESTRLSHEDSDVERAIQDTVSQLQRQQRPILDRETDEHRSGQAAFGEAGDAQRHANEDEQLEQVTLQSDGGQRSSGDSDWESNIALNDDEDEAFERSEKATAMASPPPNVQQPPLYDQAHVAGTTQSEFEAQQQEQPREKTAQEKTEEEVVLEYVKKQTLLEMQHHQNKGKDRAKAVEDEDDEDLQRALELSMRGHGHDAESRYGEASRM
ncbi:hypothetical protein LTR10_001523 [Elasticomyces elasticus]|nr:hypothetical protein LTR10_001523 [Elasticomyces elasticus]KAK4975027.1 hypothetical protein LTR42_004236 [Elasticomyces elasticus]